MRFLFLATNYSVAPENPYMTDELAGGLIARGHQVDVLHLDWSAPLGGETRVVPGRQGEKVVQVAPRAFTSFGLLAFRASKFLLSDRHMARALRRHLDVGSYDAVVAWTPALTVREPLRYAIARGVRHRVLFIYDFFPMSHREAGLVPRGPVYRLAKSLEDALYRTFTAIICNLPGNVDYLRQHYPVTDRQTIVSTPLWSDTSPPTLEPRHLVRARLNLPSDRPIAIFGGQISEGRGVEQMLGAARIAAAEGSNLLFLFIGDGRLRPMVEAEAALCANVRLLPPVGREDYLSVVGACDVGMVATVKEFSSFSFPTKTIDYLRAGLPIVAAVEAGSDYFDILARYRVGEGVRSGDADAFYRAVARLAGDAALKGEIRALTERCLDEIFDLRHAVDTLLRVVGIDRDGEAERTK